MYIFPCFFNIGEWPFHKSFQAVQYMSCKNCSGLHMINTILFELLQIHLSTGLAQHGREGGLRGI